MKKQLVLQLGEKDYIIELHTRCDKFYKEDLIYCGQSNLNEFRQYTRQELQDFLYEKRFSIASQLATVCLTFGCRYDSHHNHIGLLNRRQSNEIELLVDQQLKR